MGFTDTRKRKLPWLVITGRGLKQEGILLILALRRQNLCGFESSLVYTAKSQTSVNTQ